MKRPYLFASSFLFLLLTLINVWSFAQDCDVKSEQVTNVISYLNDLEELGYCIIPQILSNSEAEALYQRVWHEFIEKAWPDCRMDDRSNWSEAFPISCRFGTFVGPAGQIQPMWDLRQDPRIVEVFANIWNTQNLIVSMDGLSLMCPPEIRDGSFKPWPHVDQEMDLLDFVSESNLKTKPYTVQGQFLFENSFEGDGGFYCIPKSHLRFDEFAPQLKELIALKASRETFSEYFMDFFENNVDESGNNYLMKHITAPRGSLILWDSRTVHWNQYPSKDRPYSDKPKVRMVGYLCYVPAARLNEENRLLRMKAFEEGLSTTHNPAAPVLRATTNQRYLEDPGYIHPSIKLTSLGESLLGI